MSHNQLYKKTNFFRRFSKQFLSKIDLYIYKDLFPNYLFGLVFFLTILMLDQIFVMTKYYFEYNIPFNQVMVMTFNLVPFILSLAIPFAILPAFLITMGKLSGDSEITAMKACGISALRIIRPGIIFALMVTIFAVVFKDQVEIPANLSYIRIKAKIMAQKPAIEFKERSFFTLGNYNITFESMETEDEVDILYNAYVVDIAGRKIIEADKARFFSNPQNPEHYILKFVDGSISEISSNYADPDNPTAVTFYSTFDYLSLNTYIELPDAYFSKGPDTMTLKELDNEIDTRSAYTLSKIVGLQSNLNQLKKSNDMESIELISQINVIQKEIKTQKNSLPIGYIVKYNDKFATPVSAFIFALIALAIGMFSARSGRGEGLGISVIIMLVYYGFKVGLESLITKYSWSPFAIWIPNIVFLIVALALLHVKMRE